MRTRTHKERDDRGKTSEIVFIGTGTGVPSNERASPAIIIKEDKSTILCDCGPGTLRKMSEAGISYHAPDYLLLTHFHVDHTGDIPALFFASRYTLSRREKSLTILGPQGLNKFLRGIESLYPGQLYSDSYKLTIIEMDEGEFMGDGWHLSTIQLPHTAESLGYRVTDKAGKVIAISGDTDYSEQLISLGKGSNILIIECSFPEKVKGHLSPHEVSLVANGASPETLIITHLYPVCNADEILKAVKREYSGEVIIARDLLKIQV